MWVRLRRLARGGSRCGMQWFLSKNVGGLISATCGLGGPHYGEEQTAKQPYARAGPYAPRPLLPRPKHRGRRGAKRLWGVFLANIGVCERFGVLGAMAFEQENRWSHLRDVRARRPTLRGRTNSRTCSVVRFAVDGLWVD
jgi:hypothetical protein